MVSSGTTQYSQGLTKGKILLFLHNVLGGTISLPAPWIHSTSWHAERLVAKQREVLYRSLVPKLWKSLLYAQTDNTFWSGQEHYKEEKKKGTQTEQLRGQRGNALFFSVYLVTGKHRFLSRHFSFLYFSFIDREVPLIRYSLWLEYCYQQTKHRSDISDVQLSSHPDLATSSFWGKSFSEALFRFHFLALPFATVRRELCVCTTLSNRASWWEMPERAPSNDFFQDLCIQREGKKHCEDVLCFCIWNRVQNR